MILRIFGHDFHYECESLCRVYYPNEKINIVYDESGDDKKTVVTRCIPIDGGNRIEVEAVVDGEFRALNAEVFSSDEELCDKSELKMCRLIFEALSDITGYTPPWGLQTGVRPSKLMLRLIDEMGVENARRYFSEDLLVSDEKTELAYSVASAEEKIINLRHCHRHSLKQNICREKKTKNERSHQ